jgi:hypothetical protein
MRTSMKVILTAMSVAVLASPVMAQSEPRPQAAPSATTTTISNAHGSAARTHTTRPAPATNTEGSQIRLDDCVHVAFPQCSGGADGG